MSFKLYIVPTRPRTLTKVKVKHMVGTTKEESQHVDRFGRRQVWASPILEARPVILKVCFGSDGDTLRYPQVGKTVEGASQQEATVRTRRPRAPVPHNSNKERERWLQGHIPSTSRE